MIVYIIEDSLKYSEGKLVQTHNLFFNTLICKNSIQL